LLARTSLGSVLTGYSSDDDDDDDDDDVDGQPIDL
tara:strand:- start:296 stop:400 length:105 start_codon:yes stop_codon:yes gene_type:complete